MSDIESVLFFLGFVFVISTIRWVSRTIFSLVWSLIWNGGKWNDN